MKVNKITLSLLLLSGIALSSFIFITLSHKKEKSTAQTPIKKCECGPTEHWFYKACVKNYNKQFPDAQLQENNDTEGLSENILQAIDMLALDIKFINENGAPLELELNNKGDFYLPLFKNHDFNICKQILRDVNETTTVTAQELYKQWTTQFNELK